jgi:hypothetical protein
MKEAASNHVESTAREAAKHLIRKYVERGDSLESLRSSHLGAMTPRGYDVSIGGNMPRGGKYWSGDWILVHRDLNGTEVNQAFRLNQIYTELKQGQQRLL